MARVTRVLFVCTANICRSPTLQGVFEAHVESEGLGPVIEADSAGIHAWWNGDSPDPRTRAAALRRGIDLGRQSARPVQATDFSRFDHIFGVEHGHTAALLEASPHEHRHKIRNFMELLPDSGLEEMPDPYSGGERGFELVLDLAEQGARRLLDELRGQQTGDGR